MPKKASVKPKAKASKATEKASKPVAKKEAKVKSIPAVAVAKADTVVQVPAAPAKKTRIPIPPGLTGEAQKLALKWRQLFEKTTEQDPTPYKMSGSYQAKTPIKHKVLGWGYVLSANNSRIEVLFQDGIKTLITDFKE
jgi:hypothetical protein